MDNGAYFAVSVASPWGEAAFANRLMQHKMGLMGFFIIFEISFAKRMQDFIKQNPLIISRASGIYIVV